MKHLIPLLIVACSVTALNAQPLPNARLVIRTGLVEVQRGYTWLPISLGDFLNVGDTVRTASGSTASLDLRQDRIVTLNERSQVQLGHSNSTPVVQLDSGSMKVFSG